MAKPKTRQYRWIDGPIAISRIGADPDQRIARGGVIALTEDQLAYYEGRGFRFELKSTSTKGKEDPEPEEPPASEAPADAPDPSLPF